jgi:hypothetical protein
MTARRPAPPAEARSSGWNMPTCLLNRDISSRGLAPAAKVCPSYTHPPLTQLAGRGLRGVRAPVPPPRDLTHRDPGQHGGPVVRRRNGAGRAGLTPGRTPIARHLKHVPEGALPARAARSRTCQQRSRAPPRRGLPWPGSGASSPASAGATRASPANGQCQTRERSEARPTLSAPKSCCPCPPAPRPR